MTTAPPGRMARKVGKIEVGSNNTDVALAGQVVFEPSEVGRRANNGIGAIQGFKRS